MQSARPAGNGRSRMEKAMSLSKPTMSAIRFGYGIRPGEEPANSADALLAQLEKAKGAKLRFPAEGIDRRYSTIAEFSSRFRNARTSDKEQMCRNTALIRKDLFAVFVRDAHARMLQSACSPYGFHERLATFEVLARLAPCDIVLIEGYKREPVPKIEARRLEAKSREPLAPTDPHIAAIAADHPVDGTDLPVFDLNDTQAIADFILDRLGMGA